MLDQSGSLEQCGLSKNTASIQFIDLDDSAGQAGKSGSANSLQTAPFTVASYNLLVR